MDVLHAERTRDKENQEAGWLDEVEFRNTVEDRVFKFIRSTCLANYGASEAVNMCSRSGEKSTKCSEQKCASSFRE